MRSKIIKLFSFALIPLALGLTHYRAAAERYYYIPEINDLLNRTRVIPYYTEDLQGNQVPITTIAVEGVQVPGVSDHMVDPTIVGSFAGNALIMQELYVCDEVAADFESSCVVIPESYHQVVGGTLVNLFDLLSPLVWEEFLRQNPGNTPESTSSLGITNTT